MQALKTLVAAMGLLIVIGICVLVWGLYQKAANPDFKMFDLGSSKSSPAPTGQTPSPTPAARTFSDIDLNLPGTCEIADMEVAGGRLFLRIGGGSACERIIAIDPADGRVLGTISARR